MGSTIVLSVTCNSDCEMLAKFHEAVVLTPIRFRYFRVVGTRQGFCRDLDPCCFGQQAVTMM